MVFNFYLIGLAVGLIWLIVLTVIIFNLSRHYNNLTKGMSNKTLKSILEHLLKEVQITQRELEQVQTHCDKIDKDGQLHIQKIGLLRFNPFKDTGGDQSFIISLLDAADTGVVISGLYSRSGTRWYAKKVKEGKSVEHELSDEEKKAIKEAKQQN